MFGYMAMIKSIKLYLFVGILLVIGLGIWFLLFSHSVIGLSEDYTSVKFDQDTIKLGAIRLGIPWLLDLGM